MRTVLAASVLGVALISGYGGSGPNGGPDAVGSGGKSLAVTIKAGAGGGTRLLAHPAATPTSGRRSRAYLVPS